MAERLNEVENRIESIEQLQAVVSAYRGIAAARLNEAQERLEGIREYAATVAQAIGQVLGFVSEGASAKPVDSKAGAHLVIVLASEHGFVGNFNTQLVDEFERLWGPDTEPKALLFVIGSRGVSIADEREIPVDWTAPMPSHADEATSLGNRLAEAIYDRLEKGLVDRATIVHAIPAQGEFRIVHKSLIPFDFGRFPLVAPDVPPLINLPIDQLTASLAEEYVFAELCEAVMLSYAAENEKRMMAMLSARNNVGQRLEELTAEARKIRQSEITEEVIELAAGTTQR